MSIAEMLEASRAREAGFENMVEMLKTGTPSDRLGFAVNVCAILDKGTSGEAFALLAQATAKEADPLVDAFRALNKEDRMRVTVKVLMLIEQDKLRVPRNTERRIAQNGEASATDLVINVVQASKVPLTRAQILAKVRETLPEVPDGTVQGIVSGKKADGTFRHHEEAHAYSMA